MAYAELTIDQLCEGVTSALKIALAQEIERHVRKAVEDDIKTHTENAVREILQRVHAFRQFPSDKLVIQVEVKL